ncbi:MAG: hypothetical protein EBY80_13465, partial [Actinobacteria bacterium]|nr:hypothetical protein [Actinomycetota bacterium]
QMTVNVTAKSRKTFGMDWYMAKGQPLFDVIGSDVSKMLCVVCKFEDIVVALDQYLSTTKPA